MTATLLSSPHRISFLIQRGIILAMASRRFTVDPVKKKEFINIFLLMPETRVDDAMRKAEFTEKDIADLLLRRSHQRALPGGSITGLCCRLLSLWQVDLRPSKIVALASHDDQCTSGDARPWQVVTRRENRIGQTILPAMHVLHRDDQGGQRQ